MTLKLLAEGFKEGRDVGADLTAAEDYIPEGGKAELRLYLKEFWGSGVIFGGLATSLNFALRTANVPLREDVKYEAGIISIKWTKGFPFLALVIVGAIAAIIALAAFYAWQLSEEISKNPLLIIPLVLIGAGVLLFAIKGKKALPGR